jgi:hypothetical protein
MTQKSLLPAKVLLMLHVSAWRRDYPTPTQKRYIIYPAKVLLMLHECEEFAY